MKLLQSEGELTIASTGKDETGKLHTVQYRVEGPVMIFLTTTAIELDEELLNRCLVLTVDEGAEQTHAIHDTAREPHARGHAGPPRAGGVLKLHQNAQRLLEKIPVNPTADRLTFLAHKTRMRRDHLNLTLIDAIAIALLYQHQRQTKAEPEVVRPSSSSRSHRRTSSWPTALRTWCWDAQWTSCRHKPASCSTVSMRW